MDVVERRHSSHAANLSKAVGSSLLSTGSVVDSGVNAQRAELGPGDAIYIPSMWWHNVHSLEDLGALINFWWREGEPPVLTPINALYHSVITMRNLPPHELAAWRNMFDHYIFGDNGDPVEHLPESARGLLGKRTPELVARVKKMLIKVLSR